LALFRHAGAVWRRPLLAVDQKRLADAQTDANDQSGHFACGTTAFLSYFSAKVLILNGHYIPIEQFFDMDRKSAMHLMLRVHSEGIAEWDLLVLNS
jgi:hypothetical protein